MDLAFGFGILQSCITCKQEITLDIGTKFTSNKLLKSEYYSHTQSFRVGKILATLEKVR